MNTIRQPQYIIHTVAGGTVAGLKQDDVARVFEACVSDELRRMAHYIRVNRPDLRAQVDNCLRLLNAGTSVNSPAAA